ncbi:hypothetical protein [Stratiformator vulcanicus]|uniref:Uncharacterized protein n=1 Tax=Stratiformator vulcanicus TaxID=2527980 RepID=A0A517R3D1_9PLAN|nr:hypothetical protein [Stratiformator vulcanicus]QDT38399.1 hypothetical protein Pan189_27920 [Stratiformator vulcanicus]
MWKLLKRYHRLVRWAARPLSKFRPQILPGSELELVVFGLHMVIGVGHLVLLFRG